MSNNAKDIRKQVRNVVQEILPEILATEVYKLIQKEMKHELEGVQKIVVDTLNKMDERAKDTQSMILRHLASAPKPEQKPE